MGATCCKEDSTLVDPTRSYDDQLKEQAEILAEPDITKRSGGFLKALATISMLASTDNLAFATAMEGSGVVEALLDLLDHHSAETVHNILIVLASISILAVQKTDIDEVKTSFLQAFAKRPRAIGTLVAVLKDDLVLVRLKTYKEDDIAYKAVLSGLILLGYLASDPDVGGQKVVVQHTGAMESLVCPLLVMELVDGHKKLVYLASNALCSLLINSNEGSAKVNKAALESGALGALVCYHARQKLSDDGNAKRLRAIAVLLETIYDQEDVIQAKGTKSLLDALKGTPEEVATAVKVCSGISDKIKQEGGTVDNEGGGAGFPTTGGTERLVQQLKAASNTDREKASKMLAKLSEEGRYATKIGAVGGVEAIVELVSEETSSLQTREYATIALWNLLRVPDNRSLFCQSQEGQTRSGIDALAELIRRRNLSLELKQLIARAFLIVAMNGCTEQVIRSGVVETGLDLLRDGEDKDTRAGGMAVLKILSLDGQLYGAVEKAAAGEGDRAFVRLLQRLNDPCLSKNEQEFTSAVLQALLMNDDRHKDFVEEGALGILSNFLRRDEDNDSVSFEAKEHVAGCLALMATSFDEEQQEREAGTFEAMVALLKRSASTHIIVSILTLATSYMSLHLKFVQLQGVTTLVRVLQQERGEGQLTPDRELHIVKLLWTLTVNENDKVKVLMLESPGIIDALVASLQEEKVSETKRSAASALWNLCKLGEDVIKNVARGGAIEPLFYILRSEASPTLLKEEAAGALMNLANIPETRGEFLLQDRMTLLADLARNAESDRLQMHAGAVMMVLMQTCTEDSG